MKKRTQHLLKTIREAGALTFTIEENELHEYISPLATIVPLNFFACFLAQKRGISTTFKTGNKVTKVKDK